MRTPRGTPLFHALVVAGAGLTAAACGGKATDSTSSDDDGDAAAGGRDLQGAGGRGAGGRDTGGASSGGVTLNPGGSSGSGGALGAGGTYVLPDEGTLAQWSCSLEYCMYGGNGQSPISRAHRLDAPCPVTLARPRSPEDCAAGEWFDCHPAFWQDDELVWVNCACSPMADASCGSCPETDNDEATCEGQRRYCGCAQTVILR